MSTLSPVGSLSPNGLRMRVLVYSTGTVRNELMWGYANVLRSHSVHTHARARARAHTHTHTHIIIPFEDRELAGLKVDIARNRLECTGCILRLLRRWDRAEDSVRWLVKVHSRRSPNACRSCVRRSCGLPLRLRRPLALAWYRRVTERMLVLASTETTGGLLGTYEQLFPSAQTRRSKQDRHGHQKNR